MDIYLKNGFVSHGALLCFYSSQNHEMLTVDSLEGFLAAVGFPLFLEKGVKGRKEGKVI